MLRALKICETLAVVKLLLLLSNSFFCHGCIIMACETILGCNVNRYLIQFSISAPLMSALEKFSNLKKSYYTAKYNFGKWQFHGESKKRNLQPIWEFFYLVFTTMIWNRKNLLSVMVSTFSNSPSLSICFLHCVILLQKARENWPYSPWSKHSTSSQCKGPSWI